MSGDFVETSGPVLDWVLRTTWEASLIAALVLLAQYLLRGRVSARWRYNLWLLVVARLLLPAVPGTHYSPFNLVQLPQAAAPPVSPRPVPTPRPDVTPAPPARAMPVPGPAEEPERRQPIYLVSAVAALEPRSARTQFELAAPVHHDAATVPPTKAPRATPTPKPAPPGAFDTAAALVVPGPPVPQPAPARRAMSPGDGMPAGHVTTPLAASPSSFFASSPARLEPRPALSWHRQVDWPAVAAVVWVAGAAFVAARLAWVTLRLAAAVRALPPVRDPALAQLLAECAAPLRLRRLPEILEAPDAFGPALVGLLRPRVVLPGCVLRGSFHRDELRLILMHELAHMKRRDVAANWVLAVLGVFHWFNPILSLAFRRMRLDREMACDELVLSATAPGVARAYGPTILKLLQTLSRGPALPGMVGVLEGKQSIRRRIVMIARFDRSNRNTSPLFGVALSVLAGGVALTGAVRGQQPPLARPAPPVPGEVREVAVEVAREEDRPDPAPDASVPESPEAEAEAEAEDAAGAAGDAANEAREAAREHIETMQAALAERQAEAGERAAEAGREIAEAQQQLAQLQADGERALAEARQGLEEARQQHAGQEGEVRRSLEEAIRALAEHQPAEPSEGEEGVAESTAERLRDLTSEVEERERELAEATSERERALGEAQAEFARAAGEQQAAVQAARAEAERVAAGQQAEIANAAQVAEQALAEHQAALEQLALAQNAVPPPEADAPEGVPAEVPPTAEAPPAAAAPAGIEAPPAAEAPSAVPSPIEPSAEPAPEGTEPPAAAPSPGLPTDAVPASGPAANPAGAPAAGPPAQAPAEPTSAVPAPAPEAFGGGRAMERGMRPGGKAMTGRPGGYGGSGRSAGGYGATPPAGVTRAPAATPGRPGYPGYRGYPGYPGYPGVGGGYSSGSAGQPAHRSGGYGGQGGYPGMMGMGAPMPTPAAPAAKGRVEDAAGRAADARAARALAQTLQVNFRDVHLGDALSFVAEQTGVDVIADWKSLESAGVDQGATLSLSLKQGAPAEQVLAWVLRAAGGDALGYAIDHGVVVVATQDRVDRMVVTRAYPLGGLAGDGQAVEHLVRETVAPQSWRENGGAGAVRFFNNHLFVTATEPNHRQIERLLGLMEAQGVPAVKGGMQPAAPGTPGMEMQGEAMQGMGGRGMGMPGAAPGAAPEVPPRVEPGMSPVGAPSAVPARR